MTVDSEAIFAVAAHSEGTAEALEALRGSMATAWIDERREHSISVARGVGRPVWLGASNDGVFFASTKLALEVVERFLGLKLQMDELDEGTLVQLERGRETSRTRFNPDRRFEDQPLPPVRASCSWRMKSRFQSRSRVHWRARASSWERNSALFLMRSG